MLPVDKQKRDMQQAANELRLRCGAHLQSIGAIDQSKEIEDWRRLSRKTRESWLWVAREIIGDNPE